MNESFHASDPSPVTVMPYVDLEGRRHLDLDLTMPDNPTDPALLFLGFVLLGAGVGCIIAASRPKHPDPDTATPATPPAIGSYWTSYAD